MSGLWDVSIRCIILIVLLKLWRSSSWQGTGQVRWSWSFHFTFWLFIMRPMVGWDKRGGTQVVSDGSRSCAASPISSWQQPSTQWGNSTNLLWFSAWIFTSLSGVKAAALWFFWLWGTAQLMSLPHVWGIRVSWSVRAQNISPTKEELPWTQTQTIPLKP